MRLRELQLRICIRNLLSLGMNTISLDNQQCLFARCFSMPEGVKGLKISKYHFRGVTLLKKGLDRSA